MKTSSQLILPLLVLTGMLTDAQAQRCGGLSRRQCLDTTGCGWESHSVPFFPGTCVVYPCNGLARSACEEQSGCAWRMHLCHSVGRSAQDTLFNIIPSDSDGHDYELLHKGHPDQEGYAVDVDKNIASTGHSHSGDDISDYEYDYDYGNDPEYDLEDMDEDEDINSSSSDLDGKANGDDSNTGKYLRAN